MSAISDDKGKQKVISPISQLILFGYILLGIVTVILQIVSPVAHQLFDQTKIIILINAIWFSLGIVGYGIFSLSKNWRRIKLQKLNEKLDTQFLLISAFFLFALKQVIDLILFLKAENELIDSALADAGKVFEFGGFMAGLLSIYFSRKRLK